MRVFFALLLVALFFPQEAWSEGQSRFRLFVRDVKPGPLNTTKDLLQVLREKDAAKSSEVGQARAELFDLVERSVRQAMIPVLGASAANLSSGADFYSVVLTFTTALTDSVKEGLLKANPEVIRKALKSPITRDILFLPVFERQASFYPVPPIPYEINHYKIVLDGDFETRVSQDISNYQLDTSYNIEVAQQKGKELPPAQLLGLVASFVADLEPGASPPEPRLTLRVSALVDLTPATLPFDSENDQVKLDQIVIPKGQSLEIGRDDMGRPIMGAINNVGIIRMHVAWTPKKLLERKVAVDFGEFEKFVAPKGIYQFSLKKKARGKHAPALSGVAKAWNKIAIGLPFESLVISLMDLDKPTVTAMRVLTRPGLKIGNMTIKGPPIFLKKISDQVSGEAQASIDAEVKALLAKIENGKSEVLSKLLGAGSRVYDVE